MQPVSTNEYAVPPGALKTGPGNKAAQKKGTAVISIDDLERIRAQCSLTADTSANQHKTMQAKNLQMTSKDRVAKWPNTLEAVRQKREDDRIRRLEDEEVSLNIVTLPNCYLVNVLCVQIERRRVDAEEADYQD